MSTIQIPVIDFSAFLDPASSDDAKLETAKELDEACRFVGFFYLSNHGIDSSMFAEMLSNAKEFFTTASPEEKDEIKVKPSGEGSGDDSRGYRIVERADAGYEALDFLRELDTEGPPYTKGLGRNQWPKTPANLQSVAEDYASRLVALGVAIMKAFALALGVSEDVFASRVDQSFWQLRMAAYPGVSGEVDSSKSGLYQHSDFGILTFLLTDEHKGSLKVLAPNGEDWMSADPIPGTLICNIGDMLSVWTDGIYKSTQHKVIHASKDMRISIPFFFDPNWDARIEPVLGNADVKSKAEGVNYKDIFTGAIKYPY
ncbi:oxoglutarate 3-dioxygenase [Aureobasidium pullulans]|uniref:Oxoglutarate 3-dioxygenase n=1 Tax=Aureobasidium pullulans TaxID=5580 RepID=A0A4S9X0L8_AURPU|nr:oxoglutarate 3-dioxygenase [Aureobasidium pullulans]